VLRRSSKAEAVELKHPRESLRDEEKIFKPAKCGKGFGGAGRLDPQYGPLSNPLSSRCAN